MVYDYDIFFDLYQGKTKIIYLWQNFSLYIWMLGYTFPVSVSYAIHKHIYARLIHPSFCNVFVFMGKFNVSPRYVEDTIMVSKGCTWYTLMMVEGITKFVRENMIY